MNCCAHKLKEGNESVAYLKNLSGPKYKILTTPKEKQVQLSIHRSNSIATQVQIPSKMPKPKENAPG